MKRKTGGEELCYPQEMDAKTEEQVLYFRLGDETREIDFKEIGESTFLVFTLDIIFLLCVAYKCCVKLGIGGEKRESQVQIMMTIVFDIAQRFLP